MGFHHYLGAARGLVPVEGGALRGLVHIFGEALHQGADRRPIHDQAACCVRRH
jgi:hypothetical protein